MNSFITRFWLLGGLLFVVASAWAGSTNYPNLVTIHCDGNLSVIQGAGLKSARELNSDREGFTVTIDIAKNPTLEPDNEPHLSVMGQDGIRGARSPFGRRASLPQWVYMIVPVPAGAKIPAESDRTEFRIIVSYAAGGNVNEIAVAPGSSITLRAFDETLPPGVPGELSCTFSAERL